MQKMTKLFPMTAILLALAGCSKQPPCPASPAGSQTPETVPAGHMPGLADVAVRAGESIKAKCLARCEDTKEQCNADAEGDVVFECLCGNNYRMCRHSCTGERTGPLRICVPDVPTP
jgi:hypothetical protein